MTILRTVSLMQYSVINESTGLFESGYSQQYISKLRRNITVQILDSDCVWKRSYFFFFGRSPTPICNNADNDGKWVSHDSPLVFRWSSSGCSQIQQRRGGEKVNESPETLSHDFYRNEFRNQHSSFTQRQTARKTHAARKKNSVTYHFCP